MTLTLTPDMANGTARLAWAFEPGDLPQPPANVRSYEPTVYVAGSPFPFPVTTSPWIDFPWAEVKTSVNSTFALRVVVTFDDGSESADVARGWTLPPYFRVDASTDWTAGRTELLVDHTARVAAGLGSWADGSIGFAELDGSIYGFAPNGGEGDRAPGVARWEVGRSSFLGDVTSTRTTISNVSADYAAGGPIYHDAATDQLLMLYHGEVQPPGSPERFWSFIGLAKSVDDGVSWTSLGRIVEPEIAADAAHRPFFTEVGGAPYVIRSERGDDYMYVYFRETLPDTTSLNVSVARASMKDIVGAASLGTAPTFHKWHDGQWQEPGLGGTSTDLMPGSPDARWFDVAHLADHHLFVMVQSDGFVGEYTYLVRTSADGVSWSSPERLIPPMAGVLLQYVSLSSPDLASQRVIEGDVVDLYRIRSTGSVHDRWASAVLERIPLRFSPRAAPG